MTYVHKCVCAHAHVYTPIYTHVPVHMCRGQRRMSGVLLALSLSLNEPKATLVRQALAVPPLLPCTSVLG